MLPGWPGVCPVAAESLFITGGSQTHWCRLARLLLLSAPAPWEVLGVSHQWCTRRGGRRELLGGAACLCLAPLCGCSMPGEPPRVARSACAHRVSVNSPSNARVGALQSDPVKNIPRRTALQCMASIKCCRDIPECVCCPGTARVRNHGLPAFQWLVIVCCVAAQCLCVERSQA